MVTMSESSAPTRVQLALLDFASLVEQLVEVIVDANKVSGASKVAVFLGSGLLNKHAYCAANQTVC
jgi:hypothetical protein